jgi:hypothetical protein
MKRKIYNELLAWKNNIENIKPLMILGVRQSGKTYIIEEFCKKEYKNFVKINLFDNASIIELYNSSLSSDEKFNRLKLLVGMDLEKEDTILFIDEIQESEKLIAELKYFCENHNNVRIICAGSLLGVKLKRFNSSFPVGKVKMLNMYPMDFEEFLIAMDQNMLVDCIKECFENNKPMSTPIHEKALNLYRIYLITGGMPESVKNIINVKENYIAYDKTILTDILNSYFKDMYKYVKNDAEALKINRVYNSLPSQLTNISNKFQYSRVNKNAKARDYTTSIDWLEASNMVIRCKCVKNPEIPLEGFTIEDTFKLYLSDVGILNNILKLNIEDILNDNISLYKGIIAENYVANQLICNGHSLYYWKNDSTSEVDFLLYNKDGIIPIEVKAADNTQSKSLKIYNDTYHPKYSIRISTKDFGYNPETKIKSIPLYATFLIK